MELLESLTNLLVSGLSSVIAAAPVFCMLAVGFGLVGLLFLIFRVLLGGDVS